MGLETPWPDVYHEALESGMTADEADQHTNRVVKYVGKTLMKGSAVGVAVLWSADMFGLHNSSAAALGLEALDGLAFAYGAARYLLARHYNKAAEWV